MSVYVIFLAIFFSLVEKKLNYAQASKKNYFEVKLIEYTNSKCGCVCVSLTDDIE